MAKWHVGKNGKPSACHATKGNCPYGANGENHYATKAEAFKAAEDRAAANSSGSAPLSKKSGLRSRLASLTGAFNKRSVAGKPRVGRVKKALCTALAVTSIMGLAACGNDYSSDVDAVNGMDAVAAVQTMDSASVIHLKKDVFSWGDKWTVNADGKDVATIRGEALQFLGDQYVMRSTGGSVIGSEDESVFTNPFTFDHEQAKVYDAKGNAEGEMTRKTFSWGYDYTLHSTDADKKDVRAKQDWNLIQTKHEIKDSTGETDWKASKKILSWGDEWTLEQVGSNDEKVSAEDAVWLTAVINEAETHDSGSNGSNGSSSSHVNK